MVKIIRIHHFTGERKRLNYQELLKGRDLLEEISDLEKALMETEQEYESNAYMRIYNSIIGKLDKDKVIYVCPEA